MKSLICLLRALLVGFLMFGMARTRQTERKKRSASRSDSAQNNGHRAGVPTQPPPRPTDTSIRMASAADAPHFLVNAGSSFTPSASSASRMNSSSAGRSIMNSSSVASSFSQSMDPHFTDSTPRRSTRRSRFGSSSQTDDTRRSLDFGHHSGRKRHASAMLAGGFPSGPTIDQGLAPPSQDSDSVSYATVISRSDIERSRRTLGPPPSKHARTSGTPGGRLFDHPLFNGDPVPPSDGKPARVLVYPGSMTDEMREQMRRDEMNREMYPYEPDSSSARPGPKTITIDESDKSDDSDDVPLIPKPKPRKKPKKRDEYRDWDLKNVKGVEKWLNDYYHVDVARDDLFKNIKMQMHLRAIFDNLTVDSLSRRVQRFCQTMKGIAERMNVDTWGFDVPLEWLIDGDFDSQTAFAYQNVKTGCVTERAYIEQKKLTVKINEKTLHIWKQVSLGLTKAQKRDLWSRLGLTKTTEDLPPIWRYWMIMSQRLGTKKVVRLNRRSGDFVLTLDGVKHWLSTVDLFTDLCAVCWNHVLPQCVQYSYFFDQSRHPLHKLHDYKIWPSVDKMGGDFAQFWRKESAKIVEYLSKGSIGVDRWLQIIHMCMRLICQYADKGFLYKYQNRTRVDDDSMFNSDYFETFSLACFWKSLMTFDLVNLPDTSIQFAEHLMAVCFGFGMDRDSHFENIIGEKSYQCSGWSNTHCWTLGRLHFNTCIWRLIKNDGCFLRAFSIYCEWESETRRLMVKHSRKMWSKYEYQKWNDRFYEVVMDVGFLDTRLPTGVILHTHKPAAYELREKKNEWMNAFLPIRPSKVDASIEHFDEIKYLRAHIRNMPEFMNDPRIRQYYASLDAYASRVKIAGSQHDRLAGNCSSPSSKKTQRRTAIAPQSVIPEMDTEIKEDEYEWSLDGFDGFHAQIGAAQFNALYSRVTGVAIQTKTLGLFRMFFYDPTITNETLKNIAEQLLTPKLDLRQSLYVMNLTLIFLDGRNRDLKRRQRLEDLFYSSVREYAYLKRNDDEKVSLVNHCQSIDGGREIIDCLIPKVLSDVLKDDRPLQVSMDSAMCFITGLLDFEHGMYPTEYLTTVQPLTAFLFDQMCDGEIDPWHLERLCMQSMVHFQKAMDLSAISSLLSIMTRRLETITSLCFEWISKLSHIPQDLAPHQADFKALMHRLLDPVASQIFDYICSGDGTRFKSAREDFEKTIWQLMMHLKDGMVFETIMHDSKTITLDHGLMQWTFELLRWMNFTLLWNDLLPLADPLGSQLRNIMDGILETGHIDCVSIVQAWRALSQDSIIEGEQLQFLINVCISLSAIPRNLYAPMISVHLTPSLKTDENTDDPYIFNSNSQSEEGANGHISHYLDVSPTTFCSSETQALGTIAMTGLKGCKGSDFIVAVSRHRSDIRHLDRRSAVPPFIEALNLDNLKRMCVDITESQWPFMEDIYAKVMDDEMIDNGIGSDETSEPPKRYLHRLDYLSPALESDGAKIISGYRLKIDDEIFLSFWMHPAYFDNLAQLVEWCGLKLDSLMIPSEMEIILEYFHPQSTVRSHSIKYASQLAAAQEPSVLMSNVHSDFNSSHSLNVFSAVRTLSARYGIDDAFLNACSFYFAQSVLQKMPLTMLDHKFVEDQLEAVKKPLDAAWVVPGSESSSSANRSGQTGHFIEWKMVERESYGIGIGIESKIKDHMSSLVSDFRGEEPTLLSTIIQRKFSDPSVWNAIAWPLTLNCVKYFLDVLKEDHTDPTHMCHDDCLDQALAEEILPFVVFCVQLQPEITENRTILGHRFPISTRIRSPFQLVDVRGYVDGSLSHLMRCEVSDSTSDSQRMLSILDASELNLDPDDVDCVSQRCEEIIGGLKRGSSEMSSHFIDLTNSKIEYFDCKDAYQASSKDGDEEDRTSLKVAFEAAESSLKTMKKRVSVSVWDGPTERDDSFGHRLVFMDDQSAVQCSQNLSHSLFAYRGSLYESDFFSSIGCVPHLQSILPFDWSKSTQTKYFTSISDGFDDFIKCFTHSFENGKVRRNGQWTEAEVLRLYSALKVQYDLVNKADLSHVGPISNARFGHRIWQYGDEARLQIVTLFGEDRVIQQKPKHLQLTFVPVNPALMRSEARSKVSERSLFALDFRHVWWNNTTVWFRPYWDRVSMTDAEFRVWLLNVGYSRESAKVIQRKRNEKPNEAAKEMSVEVIDAVPDGSGIDDVKNEEDVDIAPLPVSSSPVGGDTGTVSAVLADQTLEDDSGQLDLPIEDLTNNSDGAAPETAIVLDSEASKIQESDQQRTEEDVKMEEDTSLVWKRDPNGHYYVPTLGTDSLTVFLTGLPMDRTKVPSYVFFGYPTSSEVSDEEQIARMVSKRHETFEDVYIKNMAVVHLRSKILGTSEPRPRRKAESKWMHLKNLWIEDPFQSAFKGSLQFDSEYPGQHSTRVFGDDLVSKNQQYEVPNITDLSPGLSAASDRSRRQHSPMVISSSGVVQNTQSLVSDAGSIIPSAVSIPSSDQIPTAPADIQSMFQFFLRQQAEQQRQNQELRDQLRALTQQNKNPPKE